MVTSNRSGWWCGVESVDELGDDVDAAMLSQHLELCRRCGLEAETYRRIKAALASRRAEVPEESIERLRAFGRELTDGT